MVEVLDHVAFFYVDVDVSKFLFSYDDDHFCSYYHYFYQKKFSDGSGIYPPSQIFGYNIFQEEKSTKKSVYDKLSVSNQLALNPLLFDCTIPKLQIKVFSDTRSVTKKSGGRL